jgi:S-(hydroxymethyl)glutathione dehydrogenase/alcohol dehydrogenase
MKVMAAVLERQGSGPVMEYRELELDPPSTNEVLVRVEAAGLCRSDLHYARGVWRHPLPVVLGHEAAGEIVAVGPGVPRERIGQKVILSLAPGCGACRFCAVGETYNCDAVFASGLSGRMLDGTCRYHDGGRDVHHLALLGAWSDHTVVPSLAAVAVAPSTDLGQACLLGCGVTSGIGAVVNTAKVRPGDAVAIFGCGGVGLSALQGARLVSADPIIAVDRNPAKRDAALRMGATHFVDASAGDPVAAVKAIVPEGVDFAFEVTGEVANASVVYQTIRRGGATVLVGQPAEGALAGFPPYELSQFEQRILGSMLGSMRPFIDFPRILRLAERGKIDLGGMVSEAMPLSRVNDAMEMMEEGRINRVVFRPQEKG